MLPDSRYKLLIKGRILRLKINVSQCTGSDPEPAAKIEIQNAFFGLMEGRRGQEEAALESEAQGAPSALRKLIFFAHHVLVTRGLEIHIQSTSNRHKLRQKYDFKSFAKQPSGEIVTNFNVLK